MEAAQPCAGFPDACPYLLTVEPDPPRHDGGVRCGCNARRDLEDMAIELATGLALVEPRVFKATLDRYAEQTRAAERAAGEQAQKRLKAVTEAVVLWRDRPGGDVGLAISLASILDTEAPEPPAATALVRVLKECDRIERAVKGNPTDPDFDGAYLACLRYIRQAAGVLPADEDEQPAG